MGNYYQRFFSICNNQGRFYFSIIVCFTLWIDIIKLYKEGVLYKFQHSPKQVEGMKPSDIDLKRKFSEAYVNNDVEAAIEYLERIVDETNNLFESWKQTRKNLSDKDKEYVLHSLAISFMVLSELYMRKDDNEQAIFYAVKTCTFPDANLEEMDIQSTHIMANLMLDHLIPKELITQIKLIKFKQDLKDSSTARKQPLLGKIDWSG